MHVGEEVGHVGQNVTERLAPICLAGDHVVEDAVLGEAVDERVDVQAVALRHVVVAQDDCEVGPLVLGQVAVRQRQLRQVARSQVRVGGRTGADRRTAVDGACGLCRRSGDGKTTQDRYRGRGGDRLPAEQLHVVFLQVCSQDPRSVATVSRAWLVNQTLA